MPWLASRLSYILIRGLCKTVDLSDASDFYIHGHPFPPLIAGICVSQAKQALEIPKLFMYVMLYVRYAAVLLQNAAAALCKI